MQFAVSPPLVLRAGIPVAIVLSLLSLTGRQILDVDREGTLPAWVSAVILLACAASLWTIADEVRARGHRWHRHWRLLALAFAYLSLDEMLSLHERLIDPIRDALGLSGIFYYAWVVVAIPVLVVFIVVLIPFLRTLPRWTFLAFMVSGGVYLAGALGMELVTGLVASAGGGDSLQYRLLVTLEELLEMLGMILFLASVNEHRRRHLGVLSIDTSRRVEPTGERRPQQS